MLRMNNEEVTNIYFVVQVEAAVNQVLTWVVFFV
jgi:hypothetical protein